VRPRAVALLALFLLLAGTSCQVTLSSGVVVARDGSGSVRAAIGLDAEALQRLGDPAKELRLGDLREAGWDVTGPRKEDDGLTWVRLSKPFATPAEADQVAAELSGPDGPFRDFHVERSRSFLKTETTFTGLADLTRGLAGLSDADLEARIEGADLGIASVSPDDVRFRVEARLPGRTQAWEPRLGERLELRTTVSSWNVQPVVAGAAALVFAAIAGAVGLAMRRHRL
jgi:hypothetical protein